MSIWIIFIVALVVSTMIVNSAYQLFMRMMGASGMFFSPTKKLFAIVIIALFLSGVVMQMFGIEIPK